jgi:intracellular septation protein A
MIAWSITLTACVAAIAWGALWWGLQTVKYWPVIALILCVLLGLFTLIFR